MDRDFWFLVLYMSPIAIGWVIAIIAFIKSEIELNKKYGE